MALSLKFFATQWTRESMIVTIEGPAFVGHTDVYDSKSFSDIYKYLGKPNTGPSSLVVMTVAMFIHCVQCLFIDSPHDKHMQRNEVGSQGTLTGPI